MNELWLFGYGSIMWKTGFEYDEQHTGFIRGWTRRFWQGSTDHRGTPSAPGRVVTLIESPEDTCWGTAYRLSTNTARETIGNLDYREKGGYEQLRTTIEFIDNTAVNGVTYIARPGNEHFLGAASDDEIAEQIRSSAGPSGSNKEYIIELNNTLQSHNIQDTHVEKLTRLVLEKSESST